MAAVFIAALSVAFTFLATVHWLPLGGEEPAMTAREPLYARLPPSEPECDSSPARPAERRAASRWAQLAPEPADIEKPPEAA